MALIFVAVFLAFVAGTAKAGKLPYLVLFVYLGASCLAFLAYAFDKLAAVQRKRRTPESTLHFISLLGGWPGAILAQVAFRHKSRKSSFQVMFWGTVAVNCIACGWLLSPMGMHMVRSLLK